VCVCVCVCVCLCVCVFVCVCAAFDPENKQSTARLHNFGCYCEGFFKTAINRSPQNLSVLYTRPLLVPALFRSWLHLPAIRQ